MGRWHPRNPWVGLAFGVGFLVASAAGFFVLIQMVLTGMAVDSRRGLGLVMFAPIVFTLAGVFTVRRAITAIAPWRMYLEATPPEQRRIHRAMDAPTRGLWRMWVYGIAALAGFLTLAVLLVVLPGDAVREVPGIVMWFEFEVLLGMAALGALVSATRAVGSREHLPPGWVRPRRH